MTQPQGEPVRRRSHPVDAFQNGVQDETTSTGAVAPISPSEVATPYSGIIQKHIDNGEEHEAAIDIEEPIFGLSSLMWTHAERHFLWRGRQSAAKNENNNNIANAKAAVGIEMHLHDVFNTLQRSTTLKYIRSRLILILLLSMTSKLIYKTIVHNKLLRRLELSSDDSSVRIYPEFVYEHPYVTSSYYTSTSNIDVLKKMYRKQVEPNKYKASDSDRGITSRLAILRPFCEFDAEPLPTTFACWNSLVPCRAAEQDLGDEVVEDEEWALFDMSINAKGRTLSEDEEDDWECEADHADDKNDSTSTSFFRGIANSIFKRCKRKHQKKDFDDVPADGLRTTSADLFLFYSQTFSENEVAMSAVDTIMEEFFSPGGWSRCFDNIYAVEANIPQGRFIDFCS